MKVPPRKVLSHFHCRHSEFAARILRADFAFSMGSNAADDGRCMRIGPTEPITRHTGTKMRARLLQWGCDSKSALLLLIFKWLTSFLHPSPSSSPFPRQPRRVFLCLDLLSQSIAGLIFITEVGDDSLSCNHVWKEFVPTENRPLFE